jgi:hypothetical protein
MTDFDSVAKNIETGRACKIREALQESGSSMDQWTRSMNEILKANQKADANVPALVLSDRTLVIDDAGTKVRDKRPAGISAGRCHIFVTTTNYHQRIDSTGWRYAG